jgi:hypothetical protein
LLARQIFIRDPYGGMWIGRLKSDVPVGPRARCAQTGPLFEQGKGAALLLNDFKIAAKAALVV